MTGTLYQQVITLLTVPPGNLVYHLVLAFSIAGALPGALNLWQGSRLLEGKRMVIGLGLLLLAQFILILDAGLAQFFPGFASWLPVLDRAVNAFSLVILIWLWIFPQPLRMADAATILLSLLIILLTILTGFLWMNESPEVNFNGSFIDMLWAGFSLILAFGGGLLSILRRPAGFGIGLGMFSLLFLGQLVYFLDPLPQGDFPGIVRLAQIAAYPLLLTLPSRFGLGTETAHPDSQRLDPVVYQQFTTLATRWEPFETCQSITAIVSHTLSADVCLLISPPNSRQYISLYCGYDLSRRENIGAATFDSNLVPVLSESLRQARPLHIPAEGNIPDLEGFGKILNLSLVGSLLSAPILTPTGEMDKALVLLTPDSQRSWSAEDQNFLADIARSLTEIFEIKKDILNFQEKIAQSNNALSNLQVEKDRLARDSAEQVEQLQTELQAAQDEITSLRAAQLKTESKEGAPK
ncbi:MAG: GAF domain-containing protein [Anaerolineales bacterium]